MPLRTFWGAIVSMFRKPKPHREDDYQRDATARLELHRCERRYVEQEQNEIAARLDALTFRAEIRERDYDGADHD